MISTAIMILSSFYYTLQLNTGTFPLPLTEEEEKHYLELSARGDLHARNILIERNLRLVAHIMKKYYAQSNEQEDLISIGTVGLIKGISSYDVTKGVRLATYAARCVENEILMYFRTRKKSAQDVSLSDCIETGDDGNPLSLMDVVSGDVDLQEQVCTKQLKRQLCTAVSTCLTEQERKIICLRYGLNGQEPLRQRQVAELTGISRSYVSRIEKRALKKLREKLER